MTTQLEDELRTELRAMADNEPASGFDGRAVLAAGRTARARRRLATAGTVAATALAVAAVALVARPATTAAPVAPVTTPSPAVSTGAGAPTRDAANRLVEALELHGAAVRDRWHSAVQQGFASSTFWLRNGSDRDDRSMFFMASYRDHLGEGAYVAHCSDPGEHCERPRVLRGYGDPAWVQTIRDLPDWAHPLAQCRVLDRVFSNGRVLELATCWSVGLDLHDGRQRFTDAEMSAIADLVGDPWAGAPAASDPS